MTRWKADFLSFFLFFSFFFWSLNASKTKQLAHPFPHARLLALIVRFDVRTSQPSALIVPVAPTKQTQQMDSFSNRSITFVFSGRICSRRIFIISFLCLLWLQQRCWNLRSNRGFVWRLYMNANWLIASATWLVMCAHALKRLVFARWGMRRNNMLVLWGCTLSAVFVTKRACALKWRDFWSDVGWVRVEVGG